MLRACEYEFRRKWRHDTETIIALAQTVLALSVMALYLAAAKPADAGAPGAFTQWALIAYPLICVGRLAYVRTREAPPAFGWISALIDVAVLTVIIHQFSHEYGTPAASLKAPTFGFYFILVALHGMRFSPARAIRGLERERGGGSVPIIAVTAHCPDECRNAAVAAGMNDILSKPIKREDFLAAIERWSAPGPAFERPPQTQLRRV